MKVMTTLLTCLLLVIILALAHPSLFTVQAQLPLGCTSSFEATVHQGPNATLALLGELRLVIEPSGSTSGVLALQDNSLIPVVGQINGRAINLIFDLGAEQYIFGVGTSLDNFSVDACGGVLGGPFVGPKPGDSGGWLAIEKNGSGGGSAPPP